jgi:hypothetical protein
MFRIAISVLLSISALLISSTYPVMADDPTYEILVPGPIGFGTFSAAQQYESTAKTITATTNSGSTTVTITVTDAKDYNPGYLTLSGADTSGATKLTNRLQVKGGPQAPSYTNLLATDVFLATDASLVDTSYSITDFRAAQTIETADLSKTAGSYSLIMTFTATFN